jgi:Ca-activated chloride channel homolog
MLHAWFSDPGILWILALPLVLFLVHWRAAHRRRGLILSSFEWLPGAGRSPAHGIPVYLRLFSLLCLIPLVAGLRVPHETPPGPAALVFVLDSSSSMTAEDFTPTNRLETVKRNLKEYVESHEGVEIGLVSFAANPQLLVPVTADHSAVIAAIDGIRPAGYGEDGTAIGSGIASAINRLRGGDWQERKIILITDGVSNRGAVSAADAGTMAKLMGVVIDSIGIGTDSESRFWAPSAEGSMIEVRARIDIDDEALANVSRITGGRYARARSSEELRTALISMATALPKVAEKRMTAIPWVRLLALLAILALGAELVVGRGFFLELPG